MEKAKIGSDGFCSASGYIDVYKYNVLTREYIGIDSEYLTVGVGLPANCCSDMPGNFREGFAVCRSVDNSRWEYIKDHRGETVYSTETGVPVVIERPGDYPEATTTLTPVTPYDIWKDGKWVTDNEAQHVAEVDAAEQQKTELLAEAQAIISLWQTELQLGIINDDDKASLIAWMNYIKAVQAVNTSIAPDVIWPDKPE